MLDEELVRRIRDKEKQLAMDVRVDDVLISRGFVYLQALIERDEELCGPGSHDQLIKNQLFPEQLERNREKSRTLSGELSQIKKENKEIPASYVNKILGNTDVLCPARLHLLWRYFPDGYYKLLDSYEPKIQEKKKEEHQNACAIWGEKEVVELEGHEEKIIDIRKEVYNAVVVDAYSRLGFEKRNRKKGLNVMYKRLTDSYAMIIEPDSKSIETLGTGTLDKFTYLGSSQKNSKDKWRLFIPGFSSYAFRVYRDYHNTRDLEACIRAQAIMYEAEVLPIEEMIKTSLRP